MERLTEKRGACDHIKGLDINNLQKCSNQALICKATDKLAAYEDTGLTPERAAELAEAERDGRLHIAPLKDGADIFTIYDDPFEDEFGNTVTKILADTYICGYTELTIGTYFLTRAEAEAALERMKTK